jgi:S1-C subfamily serine protease
MGGAVDPPPFLPPPSPAGAPLPPPPPASAPPPAPTAPLAPAPPRRRRRWVVPVAVGAVLALAGGAIAVVAAGGGDDGSPCPGADGRSRQLRRCLSESLAFVETSVAAGSGVLIADGYVVTNAHVVDPFGSADLTFAGGEHFDDVEVIGVDAEADIAVLGPVDVSARPLPLDPIPDFEEADEPDVFLVGYPGGVESDDPSVTLAGGLLSRVREDDTFGLTYLQTDAAIAGGQSGGALVDGHGTVLGISGLGFAEEFALVLSADDVADAVERILAGDGDDRRVIPTIETAPSEAQTFEVTVDDPSVSMVLPADGSRREDVEVVVDGDADVAVYVSTLWGDQLGVNDAGMAVARARAEEFDDSTIDDVDLLEEPQPGRFRLDVPRDADVVVSVERVDEDATVTLSADVPFEAFDMTTQGEAIVVGTPQRVVVDGFTFEVVHPIELEAGEDVSITVRGGTSDAYFSVLAPGDDYDPTAEADADDGGGGLYDIDPTDTFEADETGTYRIVVGTWDGIVGAYEIQVEPAD